MKIQSCQLYITKVMSAAVTSDLSLFLPTPDMAVHNFVGDAFRGATWVALHNGGGVGWLVLIWVVIIGGLPVLPEMISRGLTCRGEVINGGFGLLLDGSEEAANRAGLMLNWDVSNGVTTLSNRQLNSIACHAMT